MRRTLFMLSALLVPLATFAQVKPSLPSWFPPPNGLYDIKDYSYADYDEQNVKIDHGGDLQAKGKVWRFQLRNPKPDAWTSTIERLQQQGFRFVHGDMKSAKSSAALQKGEGDHAIYVAFWQCCNSVAIVEPATNPFHVTLKAPASAAEVFGLKDDIPYMSPIAGGKITAGQNDVPANVSVIPDCKGKSETVGTHSTWRRYAGPAGLSDFAIRETYATALRAAGWEQLCEGGSHTLSAHFTKNGRDVWVKVRPGVTPRRAEYELTVSDAGAGLRADLKKNCKASLYGVNFDFNKATLRPDAEPALNQLLSVLKDEPKLVAEIGGHTDDIGKPDYNLKLSDDRAAAVKQWLVAHGIAASRLSSHGYGETQPLVPNTNDENRAKNRRVEVKRTDCK